MEGFWVLVSVVFAMFVGMLIEMGTKALSKLFKR